MQFTLPILNEKFDITSRHIITYAAYLLLSLLVTSPAFAIVEGIYIPSSAFEQIAVGRISGIFSMLVSALFPPLFYFYISRDKRVSNAITFALPDMIISLLLIPIAVVSSAFLLIYGGLFWQLDVFPSFLGGAISSLFMPLLLYAGVFAAFDKRNRKQGASWGVAFAVFSLTAGLAEPYFGVSQALDFQQYAFLSLLALARTFIFSLLLGFSLGAVEPLFSKQFKVKENAAPKLILAALLLLEVIPYALGYLATLSAKPSLIEKNYPAPLASLALMSLPYILLAAYAGFVHQRLFGKRKL